MAVLIEHWATVTFFCGLALAIYGRVNRRGGDPKDRGWFLVGLIVMAFSGWYLCGANIWEAASN